MTVIVFAIIRLVPGDPVLAVLGIYASPDLIDQMRQQLHLNDPIPTQYLLWISGLLHGNLGQDYRNDTPISQLLVTTLPVTLELVALAVAVAILVGVPLGIAAATWRGRFADKLCQTLSILGLSIPDFWLGIMLILLFALTLRVAPTSSYIPFTQDPWLNLWHMLLPAATLSTSMAAGQMRVVRRAMIDVMGTDYIRFARAKGVREIAVVIKHGLRNAAIPIVTIIGLQSGYLFGGTVIVEQIFSLPGLGRLVLDSTLSHNYPTIQASILVLALLFVLTNLVVDSLYVVLNPRLRATRV
jgi:peptide/nickel transport system permease protein